MVFTQNNPYWTPKKYHIWNQHKKLTLPIYVSNCSYNFFFRSNFYPWSPSGICEKMNLIKKSFGQWKASSKLLKCYLETKRLVTKWSNSCFDKICFFANP